MTGRTNGFSAIPSLGLDSGLLGLAEEAGSTVGKFRAAPCEETASTNMYDPPTLLKVEEK